MTVPRYLVPVEAKLGDTASAREILKEFACEPRQAGLALRKELFGEAMLENSPTKPPRRVGD